MSEKVEVSVDVLRSHLDRTRDAAWTNFARYDQANRSYVFDDQIWADRDPYGFELYDKLRSALPPDEA